MAKLTAAAVRSAAPGKHHDLHGLILRVTPSGSRQWIWRGTVRGRRRDFGLGGFPYTTLAEARELAFQYRRVARQGGDPARLRTARAVPTFAQAADEAIRTRSMAWRDDRTEKLWRSRLDTYVMAKLGRMHVDSITPADVVSVLLPVWSEKAETGRRLRRIISAVMQAAVAAGHRAAAPAGPVLTALLPKPGRMPARHYGALPHGEVAAALVKVRQIGEVWTGARLCFEYIALTACRSGEARAATWAEVDIDTATWTVPAERTKTARVLRVPLATQALRVLDAARELSAGAVDDLLFPARLGGVMRDSTLATLPRRLGLGTVHGLRSAFRSWCSERGVDHAAAELALGHAIGSATVAAYARSDLLARRAALMQEWADYCEPR
ncbi:MAG: integrase arm-type DNA-binding domain-containing protein [Spirochaetaceae bacterium]|nr:integrase arm-type DNA-binding domain-containing protein [Spirochaetaceae bacterium]